MSIILGITGASGAIYSVRLLQTLLEAGHDVHLTISESGRGVLEHELGIRVDLNDFLPEDLLTASDLHHRGVKLLNEVLYLTSSSPPHAPKPGTILYHHYRDFMAPIASGSFLAGGMVVCPCSGTTLSAVAHASGGNLIQRAAEVQLKERRPLVLVTRETPLSLLQIENMHRATQAGAIVLPANPGWYHDVTTVADLVDFVVARICDQLGIETSLIRRWGDDEPSDHQQNS